MRNLYLLLAMLGLVVPYACLAQFLAAHGLNLQLLAGQFFVNSISTFFAVDLVITAIVFWIVNFE